MIRQALGAAAVVTLLSAGSAGAMDIVLTPDAGLSANAAALAAFQRAANSWDALFSDPITVNISAGLRNFNSTSIIGSTGTVDLLGSYSTVRNALAADAAASPNNAIVAALPTTFSANLPTGRTLSGSVEVTKANAKALKFTGLDAAFGANDATIDFNSGFAFDYDNSNGISAGTIDFQSVATHEIGHALGFDSIVDVIDDTAATDYPSVTPTTLDLFRFAYTGAGSSTATRSVSAAQFAAEARELRPGFEAQFSDTSVAYRMSTGVNSANTDGQQASHWKDDLSPNGGPLNANYIGVMDPTIGTATMEPITAADIRAFDLIGYDVAVPEPAALAVLTTFALPLIARRRRS